ncbi:DsbA family protein [Daeguia caeni]|uniref:DsbA family protein n=1 Tax=Daeguia caeni TaxID=439612 RepID=A0ABV9H948_9HYPH
MKNAASITIASAVIGAVALSAGYFAGQKGSVASPSEQAASIAVPISSEAIEGVVRDYLLQNPELLIEVQTALETKQQAEAQEQVRQILAANKDMLFDPAYDAVFGNPNGDVTVVEFFDYNCGYCKRAFPDMQAIIKNDPNVRFVMKEFPILGPDSVRAHIVAQAFKALMPEKYADYHQALMTAQSRSTEESAIAEAVKMGVDEARLREKMKDPALADAFQNSYQLARKLNINGTPSYIVGEELIPGAIGVDGLVERIAAAREAKQG